MIHTRMTLRQTITHDASSIYATKNHKQKKFSSASRVYSPHTPIITIMTSNYLNSHCRCCQSTQILRQMQPAEEYARTGGRYLHHSLPIYIDDEAQQAQITNTEISPFIIFICDPKAHQDIELRNITILSWEMTHPFTLPSRVD